MNFETILEGITSGIAIAVILLIYDILQEKQRKKRNARIMTLEYLYSGSINDRRSEMREKMYHYRKHADKKLRGLIDNHKDVFEGSGESNTGTEKRAIHAYLDKISK